MGKYGPVDTFAWVGHKDGDWVEKACQEFQDDQYKGDFVKRNGCAFTGNLQKPKGAAALNVPSGDITSYEMLHGNWIKSADCKFAEVPGFGDRKTVECICQKTN